jgi:hypothetical protein
MTSRRTLIALPVATLLLATGCSFGQAGSEGGLDLDSTPIASATDGVAGPDPSPTDGVAGPDPSPTSSPDMSPAGHDGSPSAIGRPDGTYQAGPAGTVSLRREGSRVVLDAVSPNPGWSYREDDSDDDDEVELKFRGPDGVSVDFEAELEDGGTLDIDVKEDRPATDGTTTVELPEGAGTVVFSVSGGRLSLDEVRPADGWVVRESERDDDEFEVELIASERRLKVELEVEIDDGRLEMETETRYGVGFQSGDDDDRDRSDDDDAPGGDDD